MQQLSQQQQALVPIAACAASGQLDKLEQACINGLDSGLTIETIKEILVQTYAYAGFPRSLNALSTFMQLLNQRKVSGITDIQGQNSTALPKDYQASIQGSANQTQLVGQVVTGPLFEFAPIIDHYLKTHLFGDIFSRDILSWQDREIATVSMLAALEGVESQLQAHVHIATIQGVTHVQLQQIATQLKQHVNSASAERLNHALVAN